MVESSLTCMYQLKFLARLRLGISHLNEHRLNHTLKDSIDSLCSCSLEIESTTRSPALS